MHKFVGMFFAVVLETVMTEGCQHTESNWSDGWHRGWICIVNVKQSLTFVDHVFLYLHWRTRNTKDVRYVNRVTSLC